jgi:sulfoxide reductase heme-binding subunit YedZ
VNDQLLWFIARGSGIVSIILLTAVTVLGLMSVVRWGRPSWPRFLTADLHSNLALMSVVFVSIHVISAIIDPFTNLGITAATIPFASSYRPVWVGLGVISVYLFLAMIVTSLVRDRIGQRTWRLVHYAAYLGWPLAVLHGIGAGSDLGASWMLALQAICIVIVALALAWRVGASRNERARMRRAAAASPHVAAPYATVIDR